MNGENIWLVTALLTVLVAGVLTQFVIWSRKETRIRLAAVLIFAATIYGSYYASQYPLSWPAPISQGYDPGQYKMLGVKMLAGQGIYMLIDNGVKAPRYFKFPWNKEMADKIQDMLDNPENQGIQMVLPFEWSWDQNPPQLHPVPRHKVMPDKFEPEIKRPGFDT